MSSRWSRTAVLLVLFLVGCGAQRAIAPAVLPEPRDAWVVYDTEVGFDLDSERWTPARP